MQQKLCSTAITRGAAHLAGGGLRERQVVGRASADPQVRVQTVSSHELLPRVGLRQEVVQQHALQLVAQVERVQDGQVCVCVRIGNLSA